MAKISKAVSRNKWCDLGNTSYRNFVYLSNYNTYAWQEHVNLYTKVKQYGIFITIKMINNTDDGVTEMESDRRPEDMVRITTPELADSII